MYGMNYSGGNNRTHGQVERADRIDSFEAGKIEGCGFLLASVAGHVHPLRCERLDAPGKLEVVEVFPSSRRWRRTLELARVPSGFGGDRAFWLCPRCGRRARYLYFKDRGFLCRECAGLNYRSQQRTKSSLNHYRDGMRLATEKLHWQPLIDVVPMDFPRTTPDRPRYMHRTTYQRYLTRYRWYQERYQRDSLRGMLAILRR